jgi:hypothetical protein
MTWILVGWKNHLEKSDREYRTLRKIVESWNLSGSDKNIATAIMNDLQDALWYIPQ